MNISRAITLAMMTGLLGLSAHAEEPKYSNNYWIGQEKFTINDDWDIDDGRPIRHWGLYSISDFLGHLPTKTTPILKKVKGYSVYCVSQAGVAQSDGLSYDERDIPYATFNFCDENITQTILDQARAMKEPNFAYGLKLIKVSHENRDDIGYPVLVDEKEKVIYTNNALHTHPEGKSVGKLAVGKNKTVYCFTAEGVGYTHHKYYRNGAVATPFGEPETGREGDEGVHVGRCGKLVKNGTGGVKYQLDPMMSKDYADGGDESHHFKSVYDGMKLPKP